MSTSLNKAHFWLCKCACKYTCSNNCIYYITDQVIAYVRSAKKALGGRTPKTSGDAHLRVT